LDNLWGIGIFLTALLLIEISNYIALRRIESYSKPDSGLLVSILIPARNEEFNIGKCVNSVLAQNYANFEVIVLDDNSNDTTPKILADIAGHDERLNLMQGESLPSGWTGKNWACHQLSRSARGDVLLFMDADTYMRPTALSTTVGALKDNETGLLSALPAEETITWGEKFIVPIIHWAIFCIMPLILAFKKWVPSIAVSHGQYMCFTREAYNQIGGHAAVQNRIVEDKAITSLIVKAGIKWRLFDGTSILSCRMYRSSKEAAEGLIKNLFPFFGYNILYFVFVWMWLVIVFWQPIVTLIILAAGVDVDTKYILPSVVNLSISLIIWGIFYRRFRFPFYLTFLYPITQIVVSTIAMFSMVRNLKGTAVWKGRILTRQRQNDLENQ
jgi:chlorobactene glucosyltransferase